MFDGNVKAEEIQPSRATMLGVAFSSWRLTQTFSPLSGVHAQSNVHRTNFEYWIGCSYSVEASDIGT